MVFPLSAFSYREEVFSTTCRFCCSSRPLPKKLFFCLSLYNFQNTYYHLHTWLSLRPGEEVIVMLWYKIGACMKIAISIWHRLCHPSYAIHYAPGQALLSIRYHLSTLIYLISFTFYHLSAIIYPLSFIFYHYQLSFINNIKIMTTWVKDCQLSLRRNYCL